ncbi:hypothetical protein WMY93_033595 [Mugilogobius chulae]|uniref:Amine oxidase n=1 Tax=Mugilogobius chulae TaxID=88201 RepID=A0AAW0MRI0_9GOBI
MVGYSHRTSQCSARSKHMSQGKHDQSSCEFTDLSQDENQQVQEYLLRQKDFNISTRQSTRPDHNFLFLIDLHRPTKPEVLKHQDTHGPALQREATVVVFYGVKELPHSEHTVTIGEYMLMFQFLEVLHESFRVDAQKKLNMFEQMPRDIWTPEYKELVNYISIMSVEELWDAYSVGTIVKTPWEDYGSLNPRTRPLQLGPQLMSPEGARYSVRHNQVLYLDWSFAFGLSAVTGMRVFDVRFRNERILYELSVQEAMTVYGSETPGLAMTKFLVSSIELPHSEHTVTIGEYMLMFQFLEVNVFLTLSRFLHKSFRVDAQKKLNAFEQMPRDIWTPEYKELVNHIRHRGRTTAL